MDASLFSQKYYDTYQLNITQINASLFNNFRFKVPEGQPKPDIVIFNPPYVPVEQEELDNEQKYLAKKLKYVREQRSTIRDKEQNMIAFSYMGGLDGLAITRKILKQLTWNCTFYFIVMEEEGLHQITKEIQDASALSEKHVFKAELRVLQYAQFYNEHLYVLRLILSILWYVWYLVYYSYQVFLEFLVLLLHRVFYYLRLLGTGDFLLGFAIGGVEGGVASVNAGLDAVQ
jgi:hypothetical protein